MASMTDMSDRGFTWYGGVDNGGWRFDPRLRDPAVRAAQLEQWGHERWLRCHELMRRVSCGPARKMKLLRRQQLNGGSIVVLNRHNRRARAAGATL